MSRPFADYRQHLLWEASISTVPVQPIEGASAGGGVDEERFRRRHQLGRIGVVTTAVGLGAAIVGAFGIVVALENDNDAQLIGAQVLLFTGLAGETVGEILLLDGAIGASQALGIDTSAGWVGVGLAIGAVPVSLVNSAGGSLLNVAGFVCGAVQLGQAGREGRELGLASFHVVPTRNGLRVATTF